jgi:rare lipoprotein A
MAGTSIRHLALLVAALALLSACEEGANPFGAKTNSPDEPITTDAARSVRLVNRDVEAPEVFQTTDAALWDGRPSLGGVWVASPDATTPERVILRNEANGKFVIGALFRRERENPGPKLQISSDAADALGMLAGQPGQLNVTALRREESNAEVQAAAPETALADQETATATDVVATDDSTSTDPIAAASAALDRADGATTAYGEGTVALPAAPLDDLDPTPREGETKRAARKRARLAAKAAAAADAAAPPLDATAAIDAPLAEANSIAVAPIAEVALDPAPAVSAPSSGGSARVQIGIFSVEANAQRAADTLKGGGVTADLRKEESNGKVFWSVVASGNNGSTALLAKVKELGFADAYAVSG